MSINSLTALTSGGITDSSSTFFYVVSNLQSARVTGLDLQDLGVGQIGAMKTFPSSTFYDIAAATNTVVSFSVTEYDFGSWVDANSSSLFVVPDDHWEFVQVGAQIQANRAEIAFAWITQNGIREHGLPCRAQDDMSAGQIWIAPIESGPIQVSSGDRFELNFFSSNVNTIYSFGNRYGPYFWIRPYKARA